jgi:predicted dehydrogenase
VTLGQARHVHAAGSDVLKVGLIGCGGRGSGAAVNAVKADDQVKLTAMADLFADRVAGAHTTLKQRIPNEKFDVPEDRCFSGFDAYKKLIATDVDVVILATSPHYRPAHLQAAIDANKHVFCEKPVAVDPVGVRSVLATTELANQKQLNIVSGLCWRYDYGVREVMKRIEDGEIGAISSIHENYLTGELWHRGREPDWSDMEYQNRNWLYFTWLSGDHICEQFIHSLDKALWLMGDQPPVHAFGLGGRQRRTDAKYGNAYDHFAVCYEWENGVKAFAYTRQMKGCWNNVDDYVTGVKGNAQILAFKVNGKRVFRGSKPSMYDVEHQELFAAIRSGQPINNGRYMSLSTMLAIMGREVCYTGQRLTWKDMMDSNMRLGPAEYDWTDVETQPIAIPGNRQFS